MTIDTDATGVYAAFPVTTAFQFAEYRIERTLGTCFGLTEIAAYGTAVVLAARQS